MRAGEAVFPRVAYGYRRVPRSAGSPARLEVYEPEAAVVRRIFDEYTSGASMRQVVRHLYEDGISSPDGKDLWPVATVAHLLRNRAYAGTATWYRYDYVPTPGLKKPRKVRRPPEAWVEVTVPAIVSAEVFAAAQAVTHDNSRFSARNTIPGTFLLRGLVVCGPCGVHLFCDQKRTGKDKSTKTRYYGCPNHDPLKAGGPDRRCQERLVRADELDAFVFEKLKEALLSPELLMAGEAALTGRGAPSDDDLFAAQLERIGRQLDATASERRRLGRPLPGRAGRPLRPPAARGRGRLQAPAARSPKGRAAAATPGAGRAEPSPPAYSRFRRTRRAGLRAAGLRPASTPRAARRRRGPGNRLAGRAAPAGTA